MVCGVVFVQWLSFFALLSQQVALCSQSFLLCSGLWSVFCVVEKLLCYWLDNRKQVFRCTKDALQTISQTKWMTAQSYLLTLKYKEGFQLHKRHYTDHYTKKLTCYTKLLVDSTMESSISTARKTLHKQLHKEIDYLHKATCWLNDAKQHSHCTENTTQTTTQRKLTHYTKLLVDSTMQSSITTAWKALHKPLNKEIDSLHKASCWLNNFKAAFPLHKRHYPSHYTKKLTHYTKLLVDSTMQSIISTAQKTLHKPLHEEIDPLRKASCWLNNAKQHSHCTKDTTRTTTQTDWLTAQSWFVQCLLCNG